MKAGLPWIAAVLGVALILAGVASAVRRPAPPPAAPAAAEEQVAGPCASCHEPEGSPVGRRFARSAHARSNLQCLDCHRPLEGQRPVAHHGVTIVSRVTPHNCAGCHAAESAQFARSRHAAPAWIAVGGADELTATQRSLSEAAAPAPAAAGGFGAIPECLGCHDIGRPHEDGSAGRCDACHEPHGESAEAARADATCVACHRPDAGHPATTCAGCHLGGTTHDPGDRIVAAAPGTPTGMRSSCAECHTAGAVERFYAHGAAEAERVDRETAAARALVVRLREAALLGERPLDEPLELIELELWHDLAPAAKHAAFTAAGARRRWEARRRLLEAAAELRAGAARLSPAR